MKHTTVARALAKIAHAGQVDKAGDDYFSGHLTRVADAGTYYIDVTVGLLHDIVEDTVVTLDDLQDLGFSVDIVSAVGTLTRARGVTYADFIKSIAASGDACAIRVKIADVQDHLRDISHISDSMVARYRKALGVLTA